MRSLMHGLIAASLAGAAAGIAATPYLPLASRGYSPSRNPTGALKIQRAARKARNIQRSKKARHG